MTITITKKLKNYYRNFSLYLDFSHTSCYDVYRKEGYALDIQLKRGMLEVCVLSAIKSEDSYGYKIIKDIKPYMEMKESTLYTILKRLELSKMLTVKTKEYDGRLRKYYRITKAGLERLEEFKKEWKELLAIYQFIDKGEVKDD